jgi:hypothetical protein
LLATLGKISNKEEMEFQFQKDFLFRLATASDRGDVLALWEKYGFTAREISEHSPMQSVLESAVQFSNFLSQADQLFLVALNSNGVMIGCLICTQTEWRELVVNPNFMKKAVKELLLGEVKKWAIAQGNPHFIELKSKLITGDWKAFVKKMGYRIEVAPSGREKLVFT